MRSFRPWMAAVAAACVLAARPAGAVDATPPTLPHAEADDAVLGSPAWSAFLAQLRENALDPVDEPLLRLACRAGLRVDRPRLVTLTDMCLLAALRAFDSAADYEPAAVAVERRRNDARTAASPRRFGIGAIFNDKDLWHELFVWNTDPGSPADRAGIRPHDVVVRIDGQDVAPLTSAQIVQLLGGDVGSTVRLDIRRGAAREPLSFELRRQPYDRVTVTSLRPTARVVSLRFEAFDARTPDDLARRVDELLRDSPQAPSGLIVDLRGRVGGSPDAAAQVAGAFVPDERVAGYVQTRHGQTVLKAATRAPLSAAARDWLGRVRIDVLVDWQTRREAALLALFLREQRGARIVGEQTRGDADVYTSIPLGGDASMRVRTGRMRSSTHADWGAGGIDPDERLHEPSNFEVATAQDILYSAARDDLDRP